MSEPVALPTPAGRSRDARDDARDRLGSALRELLDGVVRTGATTAEIEAAATTVESITDVLTSRPSSYRPHDNPFHPLSLVGGTAHPVGPQLRLERTGDGVAGTVRLGPVFEGGPGLAHGGVLALLFDHAMGSAVYVAGHAAMTRTLDVVYLAPTPHGADLQLSARVERIDGRKIYAAAQLSHRETVTATATALFIALTRDNVARIFRADPSAADSLSADSPSAESPSAGPA
jgi:acyl-coenzyme A thioesterase PaaI-like protein